MVGTLKGLPSIHFDNLSQVENSYWWHLSRLNWAEWVIKKWIRDTGSMEVMDFGCGTGGFLNSLCQRMPFKSSLGVDISSKAIDWARNYGPHYQKIQQGDFSLVGGKSLLLLMDTIEHIEDDLGFLGGLMSSLSDGGYVLISVPAMPSLFSEWDKALGHFRRYSKGSLKNLVKGCGGEIVEMRYIFSYLVPAILTKRVLMHQEFDETNCEFPPTSDFLNRLLLWCNDIEIFMADRCPSLVGSSLLCLVKK